MHWAMNECSAALSLLAEALNQAEPALRNEAMLQMARLRRSIADERKGLIDRDKAAQERLRLQYAVTDFLDELQARTEQSTDKEPTRRPETPTSSQNVQKFTGVPSISRKAVDSRGSSRNFAPMSPREGAFPRSVLSATPGASRRTRIGSRYVSPQTCNGRGSRSFLTGG